MSACRSLSVFNDEAFIYASTSALCSLLTIVCTNGCSGASTTKETPKIVSGRVVNTSILELSSRSKLKKTDAPIDFPIQFLCCSLIDSVQSMVCKPCNKRSA